MDTLSLTHSSDSPTEGRGWVGWFFLVVLFCFGFFGINLIVTSIYFTSICCAGQGQTKPKIEGVAKFCEGLTSSSS